MLNLVDGLLLIGRRHQEFGRLRDALTVLTRLTGFRELPPVVAEEVSARLGELQLRRHQYRRARRHLVAALRHDPANARYHHLLATALREDGEAHWERAARHFRRSLELDPQQTDCLVEFGLFAVRLGYTDEGIRHLRQACALKPADPAILGKLVKGLRLAGRGDEVRAELRAALFRNGRDRRFRQLWDDFQFQQLRQKQRHPGIEDDGPVLLPFVPGARPVSGKARLRHDRPSPLPPPHAARTPLPSDQRQVR
jgi:Flp pilus assembly protein TadD